MPPQSHMDQPYPERRRVASRSSLSRRSMLRGAAGAGAVGLAAAAGAVVVTKRQSSQQTIKSTALSEPPSDLSAGALVVYISDASTGQFDVFAGDGQVRVYNPDLVAQLLSNLKQA